MTIASGFLRFLFIILVATMTFSCGSGAEVDDAVDDHDALDQRDTPDDFDTPEIPDTADVARPNQEGLLTLVDQTISRGPFKADWNSFQDWQTPAWFNDAKFGIFVHWGVYSVPAFYTEWYPCYMYDKDDVHGGAVIWAIHQSQWGDQTVFGYKDFIPMFKGEEFNPDDWMALFVEAGARYVMPVAEHHDGFAMYDSNLTRWDASEMGPKRDTIGLLAASAKTHNMHFGLSFHRDAHWWFFHGGTLFPSDVQDPANFDLYGPARAMEDEPDEAFMSDWLARGAEIVVQYHPELFYFDFGVGTNFDPYKRRFAAFYYNESEAAGAPAAIQYKNDYMPPGVGIPDFERGLQADISPRPWQTDTSVSYLSWGYIAEEYDDFKSVNKILDVLIDVVSKNGNLLLNIGPDSQGRIPQPVQAILRDIGGWLNVNGEAIYETRPWVKFGEGPTRWLTGDEPSGDNERNQPPFTAADIRFTQKDGALYAIVMDWPLDGVVRITSLGTDAALIPADSIASVELLGQATPLLFTQDSDALVVQIPSEKTWDHAFALKVTTR
jgi:alpha-L-fucosidase